MSRLSFCGFLLFAGLAIVVTSHAEENCDVEVKLLLAPSQTKSAVASLNARGETAGHVYFFDTPALDLLSQGVIVRLRQGGSNDVTVKLRPPAGKKFADTSGGGELYKCDADLTGSGSNLSYSVQSRYTAGRVPETGGEVWKLLSAGQKKLLEAAHVSIDWTQVKRIADIKSTRWRIKGQSGLPKLMLELWQWSNGDVLELSASVEPEAAASTYERLRQLVSARQLPLSQTQKLKTTVALEAITGRKAKSP